MSYPHLFSPVAIGAMQLPNRIVMSPMTTDYGTIEQEPSERLLKYLEARAAGGVGLITLEVTTVAVDHRYQPNSLTLAEDRFIPLHAELVDRVHKLGAKIQPQITHTGPESLAPFFENKPGLGPSVAVNPAGMQSCRPLELDEIDGVIAQYAAAANRAKQAGYDGIELHAAHAYMLLASFLSPLRNGRRDEYGGKKLEGRARLLLETLAAIKDTVGAEFPVTVSLSGYERFPGGREINESQRLAQLLVDAGADALRISGGTTDRLVSQMVMGSDYPEAANAAAAEAIKQVVDVPVIVVGRVHTPELAEQLIAAGRADMVAMARPFLVDPDWPNKVRNGRREEMRQCISCENCIDSMIQYQNMNCALNALTGREEELVIAPAQKRKRVVVVGAGPAGMETARLASQRGHEVILLERQKRLGGSLLLASTVHSDNEPFYHWLRSRIRESSIELRLGESATADSIKALAPDTLVVATGAQVVTPEIPGSDQDHVFSGAQMRRIVEGRATADDLGILPGLLRTPGRWLLELISPHLTPRLLRNLSRGWLPLGRNVVIVGADLAALELAELLARRGRHVRILECSKRIAQEIGPKRLAEHMDRLDKLGVTINTEVQYEKIERNAVYFRNTSGQQHSVKCDSVILAGEPVADTALFEQLEQLVPEAYAIGDCTGLGLIRKATEDAMRVACAI